MEFARKIKDEEKQGRATMVLSTPDDERLREKFYDQVVSTARMGNSGHKSGPTCHVLVWSFLSSRIRKSKIFSTEKFWTNILLSLKSWF